MSKMFYNYDNNIDCCNCDCVHLDPPAIMLGWSGTEIIYDEHGDEVGLGFNNKAPITLFFNIDGCIIDDYGELVDVDDYINSNKIKFELLNFKHQVIYKNIFDGRVEDGLLILKLGGELVENLVPEIYYVRLTLQDEDNSYILFTPHDGLIHIS